MNLVKLEWTDIMTGEGWIPIVCAEVEEQLPIVISVGFVIYEDDERISLAGTIASDGDVNCRIHIPKGCIRKRTELSHVESSTQGTA